MLPALKINVYRGEEAVDEVPEWWLPGVMRLRRGSLYTQCSLEPWKTRPHVSSGRCHRPGLKRVAAPPAGRPPQIVQTGKDTKAPATTTSSTQLPPVRSPRPAISSSRGDSKASASLHVEFRVSSPPRQPSKTAAVRPEAPEVTSTTLGILSQLRWEASRGSRKVAVVPVNPDTGYPAAAHGGEQAVISRLLMTAMTSKAAFVSASALLDEAIVKSESPLPPTARPAKTTKVFAELRRFRTILQEELQNCNSKRKVDQISRAAAAAVCCCSPGYNGGFVVLDDAARHRFLNVVREEATKRAAIVSLLDSRVQDNMALFGSRSATGKRQGIHTSRTRSGRVAIMQRRASDHSDGRSSSPSVSAPESERSDSEAASQGSGTRKVSRASAAVSPLSRQRITSSYSVARTPSVKRQTSVTFDGDVNDEEKPQKRKTLLPTSLVCRAALCPCGSTYPVSGFRVVSTECPQCLLPVERAVVREVPQELLQRKKRSLRGKLRDTELPKPTSTPPPETPQTQAITAMPAKSEEVWIALFKRMQEDGSVHKDDLPRLLERMGLVRPVQEWIDRIHSSVTKFSTLKEDAFVKFVKSYSDHQQSVYRQAIQECDVNGDGTLRDEEIHDVLIRFGLQPLDHVLEELLEEVKEFRPSAGESKDSNVLDLASAMKMLDLLRLREGFTRSEYESFVEVFQNFDRDGSGEMDARELQNFLQWFGFPCDQRSCQNILMRYDIDGTGSLRLSEVLLCTACFRDKEIHTLEKTIEAQDSDGNGTLNVDELEDMLKALNYVVDSDAVDDALEESGLAKDSKGGHDADATFGLSELWRFLLTYRSREGFDNAEIEDVEQAFDKFSDNKENPRQGEINYVELGRALRMLGCYASFEELQALVHKVDTVDVGTINFAEFKKLVRYSHGLQLDRAKAAFATQLSELQRAVEEQCPCGNHLPEGHALCWQCGGERPTATHVTDLPLTRVRAALISLGVCDESGALYVHESLLFPAAVADEEEPCIDEASFLSAAKSCLKHARKIWREEQHHGDGFSGPEHHELRQQFDEFDKDGSGELQKQELVALIERLFPNIAHSTEHRPTLEQLLKEVDNDGSGRIDFEDYLRLVGELRAMQDRERFEKETKMMAQTGFNKMEVAEFRELFLASDVDGGGALSLTEVQEMIHAVCPLGTKNLGELQEIFGHVIRHRDLTSVMQLDTDEVDFPEFLALMRRLLDVNFAQIRDRTGAWRSNHKKQTEEADSLQQQA
eukprot:TRINITY_DN35393_c0_g1_i1.p1 TRINITY_DN35393_c0_g1~~TRINITY_DN35393_c0_g1_i1.p1  ORF type:complete len:1242 (-),score=267.32 TRINITY_DN35393_c0_g1_i1:628-4353(-)